MATGVIVLKPTMRCDRYKDASSINGKRSGSTLGHPELLAQPQSIGDTLPLEMAGQVVVGQLMICRRERNRWLTRTRMGGYLSTEWVTVTHPVKMVNLASHCRPRDVQKLT